MPPAIEGFWGRPTATIDWCEENYVYSYYIAEMTNTISNLMMIIPPIWGMFEVIRQGFERRFVYCHFLVLNVYIIILITIAVWYGTIIDNYLNRIMALRAKKVLSWGKIMTGLSSIYVVGLGSWAFHMTLLYEMQLFDELPMVYGTSVLVYCLSEVEKMPVEGKFSNFRLFLFLSSFAVLFTALYLLWPQPLFQHTYYGILVLASFVLEIRLLRIKGCQICKKLFILALTIYLFGFFLWNMDNLFCNKLRSLRMNIPTAFDPLTQLHGWWHCMAGYGTYLQVLFTIHATFDFRYEKQYENLELRPSHFGFALRWFKKDSRF